MQAAVTAQRPRGRGQNVKHPSVSVAGVSVDFTELLCDLIRPVQTTRAQTGLMVTRV